jgi:glycosyltransferase involved in cell wall biosynthesis
MVIPPGVDLENFPVVSRTVPTNRPIRLLLVGGDFKRKGGELLLEVMRSGLSGQFELDIVTRDEVAPGIGVRVHRFEHGDPGLVALYRQADLFVMPSLAECFGIATVEAMATGLPVVVSNIGGARDIVDHAETGWLIPPTVNELRALLTSLLGYPERLVSLGEAASAAARRKFRFEATDAKVIDRILALGSRNESRGE